MSSNQLIHHSKLSKYYLTRKYPNGWLFTKIPSAKIDDDPLTVFISINDLHKYGYKVHLNNTFVSRSSNINHNRNRSSSVNTRPSDYNEKKTNDNDILGLSNDPGLFLQDIHDNLDETPKDKDNDTNKQDDYISRALVVPNGSKKFRKSDSSNWRSSLNFNDDVMYSRSAPDRL